MGWIKVFVIQETTKAICCIQFALSQIVSATKDVSSLVPLKQTILERKMLEVHFVQENNPTYPHLPIFFPLLTDCP